MKDLPLRVHVVVKTLNLTEFHVVICQTTSKSCTKVRAARAERLCFLNEPIRSLFSGVVVAVAVAIVLA